ncbi:MAG TPA: phosphoribosylanthranilate isomerase [Woeseiaceae bacterium]|nr:phosphoribosylanthranilate isomerase [Woeseiaceae bacterium]
MIGMVKICGLTDAAAVRAAVAAGADAVGFVFAASARRVTPQQAAELAALLPADVLSVAVMQHPRADDWDEVLRTVRPRVLQTDIADFARLAVPADVQRWPVLREDGCLAAHDVLPEVFLYEGRASGRGEAVDWQQAAAFAKRGRMILAGGLSAANVGAAIRAALPWGVDVSSGVESAPGRKDPRKIAAFIAAARAAATH